MIVKAAWGGKSLAVDFRPPSAVLKRGANDGTEGEVGFYYNEIINTYNNAVSNIDTLFPDYNGQGVELVGLGWHQGWNDRVNQSHNDEYEANMADFISDIRDDLGVADLPFVIAETGMGGFAETHPRALSLMEAQANIVDFTLYPEFEGNVAFVGTKEYWREASDSPVNQNFHWNGNGETNYLIGDGMGTAMQGLVTASIPEPNALILLTLGSLVLASRRKR